MEVYLIQHGVAVDADVDPERPLTDGGRAEVVAVADAAHRAGVRIDRIVHSDKLRAVQTAREVADRLGTACVDAVDGLHPNDPVEPAAERWADPAAAGSIGIVGHLPFLDRLASLLVTGDPDAHVIAFRNAALVVLRPGKARGGYGVAWILSPEQLPRPERP